MTRKATPQKTEKSPKKAAKPKPTGVYTVVREIPAETTTHSEPERVFATKKAAEAFAAERNRELRDLVNPFADYREPGYLVTGGPKAFDALLKKLGLTPPVKPKGGYGLNWGAWWDAHYFDMTDAQRGAIWDALDKFEWYQVRATTLED